MKNSCHTDLESHTKSKKEKAYREQQAGVAALEGEQQAGPVALNGDQQARAGGASRGAVGSGWVGLRAPLCHRHQQRHGASGASSFGPQPRCRALDGEQACDRQLGQRMAPAPTDGGRLQAAARWI
jgi:hypothetical protein